MVSVLQRKIELALTALTAIHRPMFVAQNEQYLASLFPKGAKHLDGNGEDVVFDLTATKRFSYRLSPKNRRGT